MMYTYYFFAVTAFLSLQLNAEGFVADTLVHNFGKKPSTIKHVCDTLCAGNKRFVSSWHEKKRSWSSQRVRRAGQGSVNCTVTLTFDHDPAHDITCSPIQQFYLLSKKGWVAAQNLCRGDLLRTESGGSVLLAGVVLNKQEAQVYALRVKKSHTFCVGHYRLLTHNMSIPLIPWQLMAGLSGTFGTAGAVGSFFGPLTLVGGLTVGGIVCAAACAAVGHELYQYHMKFGELEIERTLDAHMSGRTLYVHPTQTLQPTSKGYSDINVPVAPVDILVHSGCGNIKPPEYLHTGCEQPPVVFDELPIGCGVISSELSESEKMGCCPGPLVYSFAQKSEGQEHVESSKKTIEDILKDCECGRKTKGKSKQFEKEGRFEEAEQDFESLELTNIRAIPNGKAGDLPDGRTVNVRTESSFGTATLEVRNNVTSKKIKVRYIGSK